MMLKAIAASVLVSIAMLSIATPSYAANERYCRHYADQALWQLHRAQSIPGCFHGYNNVWNGNWDHHYNWCRSVSYQQARNGDSMRGDHLHECTYRAHGHY